MTMNTFGIIKGFDILEDQTICLLIITNRARVTTAWWKARQISSDKERMYRERKITTKKFMLTCFPSDAVSWPRPDMGL